jgi:P-type Ca2+ transporter type 2C
MASQPPQQGRTSTTSNPPSPQDDAVSPTTTVDPLSGSWASSTKTNQPVHRPELKAATSFDSKDSRPTSPHNVSSPVLSRAKDGAPTFLSVPSNLRSRQNSVDSDDASRSAVSSTGETAVASTSAPEAPATQKRPSSELSNSRIMNDETALRPDKGSEADFVVENNPFAFSPGQMNKMFAPKNLAAFYQLGGMRGIEKGLQSDRKSGLSVDEIHVPRVTFQEATQSSVDPTTPPPTKLESEGLVGDSKEQARRPSTALSHGRHQHEKEVAHFADRKRVFRDNRLPEKKGKTLLQLMWITYNDKVLMLLTAAAVISLGVGLYQTFGVDHSATEAKVEWVEGVAIVGAIAIVVIVGSLNDYQKERQFARLNRKKQDRKVKVIRSGKAQEISVYDILVGDVIHLEPGDMVPVDGILIEGFDIKCDESQATGESDIIKKQAAETVFNAIQNHASTKKLDPFIQSGARVMEGVGTFMCTSTGIYSSYGRTLMALTEDPEMTPLQSKLNIIAEYIAKVGGAAGLLLFIVLFILFLANLPKSELSPSEKGKNFLEIFIVVVTIIVVAVPEGLPLAVTLALAFATNRMLKDNNLVRHLKACEVMGNATTICSDKTGTLTQNKMKVVAGTVGSTHRWGRERPPTPTSDDRSEVSVGDNGPEVTAGEISKYLSSEARSLIIQSIAVNSTAFESDEMDDNNDRLYIGSKTETALLLYARDDLGMGVLSVERANANVLQLFPFDSGRKCMGVVVSLGKDRARLYVKGASEIVLGQCAHMWTDPTSSLSTIPMTGDHFDTVTKLIAFYASNSLRTIGMAYRDFEQWPPRMARRGDDDEILFEDLFQNMVFTAMVGIQDPLRDGVPEAVRLCQMAGVVVRMVTGDNKLTAEAIARECGILQPNSIIMEGPEFRNMTKAQQEQVIPRLHVLARSSPEDKRILVKRLKDKSEIVAVPGDGTNDAPALRMADVGFSMGIAGTEVAKEASSIILMDDNFNSIVKALKWGRAVNDAVKRFLQFQLTVNVTAVVLTFVSAVSNKQQESVLTAVQLLWVNLIMDTLAALALATDPPHDSILNRKPEPRNASIISTTMWKMILGQAVYQLTITFILYFGRENVLPDTGVWDIKDDATVATLVFNTFVWMQIFNQWK